MAEIGKAAPEFKLKSHDGSEVSLSQYRESKHSAADISEDCALAVAVIVASPACSWRQFYARATPVQPAPGSRAG